MNGKMNDAIIWIPIIFRHRITLVRSIYLDAPCRRWYRIFIRLQYFIIFRKTSIPGYWVWEAVLRASYPPSMWSPLHTVLQWMTLQRDLRYQSILESTMIKRMDKYRRISHIRVCTLQMSSCILNIKVAPNKFLFLLSPFVFMEFFLYNVKSHFNT